MFNPTYRILITSKCFPKDEVIGLGKQMIFIVNSIKNYLPPHLWYGADIDAVGKGASKHKLDSVKLCLIGTDLQLVEYCSEIEQFIWGEFLCIDRTFSTPNIQGIELETEDIAFRSINSNGVIIEIRAFDTTYFGVYSEDVELITKMSKIYDIDVEKIKL